jgi:hypothetical protein
MEVFVNTLSAPMMILAPQLTMRDLLYSSEDSTSMPEEVAEVCRWFGCMIFAFGAVQLYLALQAPAPTLRLVLQSFLVGDVIYTSASAYWSYRKNIWGGAAIFNVAFSTVLGIARMAAVCDLSLVLADSHKHKTKRK